MTAIPLDPFERAQAAELRHEELRTELRRLLAERRSALTTSTDTPVYS